MDLIENDKINDRFETCIYSYLNLTVRLETHLLLWLKLSLL